MGKKKGLFTDLFGDDTENIAENETAQQQETTEEVKVMPIERVTEEPKRGETVLAVGTLFEGNLKSNGDVDVQGDFTGDIVCEGRVRLHGVMNGNVTACTLELIKATVKGDVNVEDKLTISDGSEITGNVGAKTIVCSGKIIGDVFVQESTVLQETANICGNIKTDRMTMANGAKVGGNIEMER